MGISDNKDLVWDLNSFSQRQRAVSFVMGFENKLCVFSGNVGQLYTNYNLFFPNEESRSLVVLPNPYAPHDTYNGIPSRAITATGLNIVLGAKEGKDILLLSIPFKSGKTKHRLVPLKVGLHLIRQRLPKDKVFLPVLMKGDLRELNSTTPCLHLHCIHVDRLEGHSTLVRSGIKNVIEGRLASLV